MAPGRKSDAKPRKQGPPVLHQTKLGRYILGKSESVLRGPIGEALRGKVQLILTSPPFPLNKKKSYGNLEGDSYRKWFVSLAETFADLLTPNGSIVIELGNAWEAGKPVQSLLPLECLIDFVGNRRAGLHLCQEFISYNPARLPSPAQWVTVTRERATDSYTRLWWMSTTARPKADNSRVLRPYSDAMRALLKRGSFNHGKRPSGHSVSKRGFLSNNGGSIPHNLVEVEGVNPERPARLPSVFSFANTVSSDAFAAECKRRRIVPHPARMHPGLASFFIEFLTDEGDIVLDPFGGSNTTGLAAEVRGRRWLSIDASRKYARQSRLRFAVAKKATVHASTKRP